MSFRGDDQRRYGHLPPVQYPTANQHQGQAQHSAPARRPSFHNGDDAAHYESGQVSHLGHQQPLNANATNGQDELFIANSPDGSRAGYGSGGYQNQYAAQAPPQSAYNPQAFVRSQSIGLPFHPSPSARWGHTASNASSAPYSPVVPPSNFSAATYNPAAYATPVSPQRTQTYSGYNNYNSNAQPTQSPSAYSQSQHWQSGTAQSPPAQYTGFDHTAANYPPASSPVPPPSSHSYDSQYSQYPSPGYPTHDAQPSPSLPPPPASPRAPYPTYSQIPVGPAYNPAEHAAYNGRSSASPVHPRLPPSASSPGLARHPTNAPLPSRPQDDYRLSNNGANGANDEQYSQEDIMQDIEASLSRGSGSHRGRPGGLDQRDGAVPVSDLQNLRRLTSSASYHSAATTLTNQEDPSGVNRYSSSASTANRSSSGNGQYKGDLDDDSDPEGAAGAWALQQAEEDERRLSTAAGAISFPYFSQPEVSMPQLPTHAEEPGSDSDYAGMDLGLAGGGFSGNLNYDNNVGSPPYDASSPENALATPRRTHASQRSHDSSRYPAFEQADIDYGNTGGLQAPRAHRLSFDEDDEQSLSRRTGSDSPQKEDYPDMFYHPGLSSRPLPAIPLSESSSMLSIRQPQRHGYSLSSDSQGYSGPDALYGQNAQQLQVERSISLASHSNTPIVQPPGRSKTDAEDRNSRIRHMREQQRLALQHGGQYDVYEPGNTTPSLNYDDITLPTGKRKRFQPDKLTHADVQRCYEPWALSGIAQWIRELADGEPDLKRKTVEDGLVRLFCLKVPTMNVADAELLGTQVAESMLAAGILVPEEEWLKFGHGSISGVLWQLTGYGCYAPKAHEHDHEIAGHEVSGRCYSYHCTRTLKKANLDELMASGPKPIDWAHFYNLSKADIESKPKKEVERQNILHEIVTSEETYMSQLDVLRILYRDQLVQSQPRIIAESRLDKFVSAVFGRAESIQQVNKDHLLAQLKYRQKEQGPWIIGFSDIFREWIRAARSVYIDYASAYPNAQYLVRKESERNFLFKQYLDQNQNNPLSQRLDWSTFLKSPITRLQRYILLMQTVLKHMIPDSEDKNNLIKAIDEVRNVALEADARVDEMQKKVTMVELNQMLVLRPGFHADLNLDHLGRELILEGDLQRLGSKGVRWVDTHALLFDHYLILAKLIVGGRQDKKYDVSREPIPMPLLFLESSQDDAISKQKSIAAPLTRTGPAGDVRLNKVQSNGDRPGLEHTATSSSIGSGSINRLGPGNQADAEGKILYPFRIKHLGHEVYTLFATSAQSRQDWCDRIIEAKTRHAKALHAQNAEPFRLRVMADSAFAYDAVSAVGKYVGGVHIRGTPLDRAIRELEKTFGPGRGPAPISRASVNCATGFSAFGKSMVAVGTDVGVCVSEASDQRNWIKTVAVARVSQIAVLEEFSVVLVLSERNLISYPLDVIAPPSNFPAPSNDSHRRSPLRLAKDVSFFATARMKERMLVFYKRKESLHSTFKVLEPVFQKSSEKKTRLFSSSARKGAGSTDSFRDYDEFYLPTDCFGLNIFQSYIAIATAKGFELMTLDKKVPMSIPDVKQPAIANIANRIKEQKPLGMFRLNEQEFILAYEDCAVYIDKHGDVSRSVIMEYSGKQKKAKGATMYGQYLLLFNEDYVEVRNAENGRLRQIIAGRDVRVLDYGVRGPTGGFYSTQPGLGGQPPHLMETGTDSKGTVKICMAHPEVAGQQIVLEMLLNTGHAEK